MFLIEELCERKGLGVHQKISTTACHTMVYICILMVTGTTSYMDFCLQGSGDLRMCCSQTDLNIAQIYCSSMIFLMFYQAMWYVCRWRGLHIY